MSTSTDARPSARPLCVRLILTAALALTPFTVSTASALAAVTRSTSTPVVMVHGYNAGTCPGSDVLQNVWAGEYQMLTWEGWTGALLPVSYFACDTDGVDITGYGPTTRALTPRITPTHPRNGYDDTASIDQIAHDLAWFVYDTYSKSGKPVDFVGASMGGLIIRSALFRVQQHQADFPPKLLVTDTVTFSTPHNGVSADTALSVCGTTPLCTSMVTGSAFLTSLGTSAPQGAAGTDWTLVGSTPCDFVPPTSSLSLWPAHLVEYVSPCYTHVDYLWDYSATADAQVYYLNPGAALAYTAAGQHSLVFVGTALRTGTW